MSVEVLLNHCSGHDNLIYLSNNETKYVYERGNEAPRLIIRSRNKIGVDIVVGDNTLHLPCFLEDSDHLLHNMKFILRDKIVLIRTF